MYLVLRVKCPLFLSDFEQHSIVLDGFSKNPQISHFMKMRLVGARIAKCRRTDGQTDETNSCIFDVLLTVHLSIILGINQLNAQILVL